MIMSKPYDRETSSAKGYSPVELLKSLDAVCEKFDAERISQKASYTSIFLSKLQPCTYKGLNFRMILTTQNYVAFRVNGKRAILKYGEVKTVNNVFIRLVSVCLDDNIEMAELKVW